MLGRLVRRALLTSSQGRAYFQNLFENSNTPTVVYPSSGDAVLEQYDYGTYANTGTSSGLAFSAVSGVTPTVDQTRIKGLKTYEIVAILSGTGVPTTYVQRAFYYDALGRLKTTSSGSGANAVTTTDTFNIQGWLTARSAMKGSTNIFSMSLGYYTPVQSGATARYSGDISSWAWTQYGQPAKAYAFTYDGAHRLTAGQFYNNGSSPGKERLFGQPLLFSQEEARFFREIRARCTYSHAPTVKVNTTLGVGYTFSF